MSRSSSSAERSPRTRSNFRLVSTAFRANVFWLGKRPLEKGRQYQLRVATKEVDCEVAAIHRIIDTMDLAQQQGSNAVNKNQVAELTLRAKAPVAFDLSASFEVDRPVCLGGRIRYCGRRHHHRTGA